MARPKKLTVDYFPHDTAHGSTMMILESNWGNDGYAFWFKLLESLGTHQQHFIDCRKSSEWELLMAKTRVSHDTATDILNMLAKLDAIDCFLWQKCRVIFCLNFLNRIEDAYRNRKSCFPSLETVCNAINVNYGEFLTTETPDNFESDDINRERERERESKRENIITTTPLVVSEEQHPKMTFTDFRFLHADFFGQPLPGGCNEIAHDLCRRFTTDTIRQAFQIAAGKNRMNLAYVKGVLEKMTNPSRASPVKPERRGEMKTFEQLKWERTQQGLQDFLKETTV